MVNPSTPTREVHAGGLVSSATGSLKYPFTLNFYSTPPSHDITIEVFERLAVGRLQVLRAIESGLAKGQREEELISVVRRAQEKYLPLHSNESAQAFDVDEERHADYTSHWLLRLAFASSPDSARWFVTHEAHLFKLRYAMSSIREKADFIRSVNLPYEHVTSEEKQNLYSLLANSTLHCRSIDTEDFIKVPWTHVLDLVAKRQVLLDKGIAFVPHSDMFSVIFSRYKERLEADMEKISRLLLSNPYDDRIRSLLDLVRNTDYERTTSSTSKGTLEELTANDIDTVSTNFPPCMASMYYHLKQEKHLKYNGRTQFGLFLKSIGLPFNEAMLFWKRAFSKFSDDEFTKNYAYNVRHNYGLEGKRANYGCLSCKQIISSPQPAASDHSGCPFRHSNIESLGNLLVRQYNLTDQQVKELAELSRSGNYQPACTRLLEMHRPSSRQDLEPITMPTQFYEASLKAVLKK